MLIGIDASRTVTQLRTGTEAYAYFLIQALIEQAVPRGHRLRLYFNQAPPPDLFPHAAHVERVIIPFPRLWTHLRLAWELLQRPPDVFFTPAHVIPLTHSGRSVATIHDLGYRHFPQAHPRLQRVYLCWSTRHNGRVARRVIVDSQATKTDLIRFDGLEEEKIDVIYPGVDPNLHPVSETRCLQEVQARYQVKSPYLLYVGTLQPRKNVARLVEAYLESQVPHQLVLAGKAGWLSGPILDTLSHRRATADQIRLPGFIEDSDKAALISGATALLFPSLYEGFGFPVLEAQACSTPVICADTSSLPEVAGPGALLVDPLDTAALAAAIQQIAADQGLRQELIRAGFENVKRFTWEEAARKVLRSLEKAAR